jgi:mRNA-degrading endonuclease RelE of RelBE toxin-antitoxin system
MFIIEFAAGVADDVARLRATDRRRILDNIDEQLQHEPAVQTRNKKMVPGLVPPWIHIPPVWELRVGEFRVFYDVDKVHAVVYVRAIRRKPPHKTTEEIL